MIIKKGASYSRVSTKGQAFDKSHNRIEDGSLEMQTSRIKSCLEYKSNDEKKYELIYELEDAGLSGKNTNRPDFKRMWSLIKNNEIDFVIATDISRLSRSTADFLNFVKHCSDNSVELIMLNPDIDSSTPWGKLALTILASLAEFEREQTVQRLKINTRERLKKDGKINGAAELIGLRRCSKRKGHFVICDKEIPILEEILGIYLKSSSKSDALKEISKRGIKAPNGSKMKMNQLKLLLKNVQWRYSGKWYLRSDGEEEVISLDHGPLLGDGLINDVIKKIEESQKLTLRKGKGNHIYLLSRILKNTDGDSFHGEAPQGRSKKYRYYKCRTKNIRVNADELELFIEERVIKYFKKSDIFENIILRNVLKNKDKVAEVDNKVREIGRELSRLKSQSDGLIERLAILSPNMPTVAVDAIGEKLKEISFEKESNEIKLENFQIAKAELKNQLDVDDAKKAIEHYANKFKTFNRVQKRNLIEEIFEKIELVDTNTLKLCIKKAPKEGLYKTSVNNGSTNRSNGGTCKI